MLFKYVKLSPTEIYELGNESKTIVQQLNHVNQIISSEEKQLTDEEIRDWADKKRERGILLHFCSNSVNSKI